MAPDDVTAIASLLQDPAVELLAITVSGSGEAHCPGGMFVARSLVTMLREDAITVACGRGSPMGEAEPFPTEWRAAADAGSGLRLVSPGFVPDSRDASQVLVELATAEAAAGRPLTLLTLGPLTNLAAALELDATLPEKVRVVSMLGAVAVPGNVATPASAGTAEWNARADPTAVRLVLEAGFDLTLVPLDATNRVPLTSELHASLEADHAAGPADVVFELWSQNPYMVQGGFYLWDPLAAAAVRDPSIVTTRAATLRVEEGAGPDGGRLVEDPTGATVTIATAADRERFEALLLERLRLGPPREDPFTPIGTVRIAAADGTCDVQLDPPNARAGLLRFEAANAGSEAVTIFAFALGTVPWSEVEAYAAAPQAGFAGAPVLQQLAWIEVGSGSSGAWNGDAPEGQIGVACTAGTIERPVIVLAGPFPVGGA